MSLNVLLPMIQECTGTTLPVRDEPVREGDIVHSGADISAAISRLDYCPATSLTAGLAEAAAYYKVL